MAINLSAIIPQASGNTTVTYGPHFTTTQRNAISPVVDGMLIFNTTLNKQQVRVSSAWANTH